MNLAPVALHSGNGFDRVPSENMCTRLYNFVDVCVPTSGLYIFHAETLPAADNAIEI